MSSRSFVASCAVLLTVVGLPARDEMTAQAPAPLALRVGAAKVDITPAQGELPKNSHGVLDRLYARAIVLDNGATSAALITVDAGALPDDVWQAVTRQLRAELGIPSANVVLTATHTHSGGARTRGPDYASKIAESARLAKQNLAPARVGYGTGLSYINVNRHIVEPATNRWSEGANYDGPSDKTVAVLAFERLTGEPIAVYYNYAVHAVIAGQLDQISGDIPAAASRYIEESLDGSVAVWSTGAAGDQNPIYFQQTYDLRAIRIKEYAARGVDISNAMPPGGEGLDRANPKVAILMNQQRQMVLSMGQFLGEEVLRVVRGKKRTDAVARIHGSVATASCPGRERTNQGRAGFEGAYKDAEPIEIRLGLLRLGDVMIGAVNAEVFNPIAQRLKRESPYKATLMATLTNGFARSGYVPDDASYGKFTFEVLSSRLKPGCAESAIVNGLLELMQQSQAN